MTKYLHIIMRKSCAHKALCAMSKDELHTHCRNCGLDDTECRIAEILIIQRLRGQCLYNTLGYSERQAKRIRKRILDLIQ